jgi:hypothetical protein
MSLSRFYLMLEPELNHCVADVNEKAAYEMEKIRCPIHAGHSRGRRTSPLDMVVPCDPPPSLIFTWMSECLIQEPARLAFERERLTGFSTMPARARVKKTGVDIPVHELTITGWGGIAPESSGIRLTERCSGCGHLHYSSLERPEELLLSTNWDGSDFFMIWPLPRFRFVTERVVEACQRHGVTGVVFSANWSPARRDNIGFSPGRLSYYMPQERAHLLGGAFGIE